MATISPVFRQLVLDGAMQARAALPGLNPVKIIFLWFSAVLIVLGTAFLFYAEYVFWNEYTTPQNAALMVALTTFVLSSVIGLSSATLQGRRKLSARRYGQADDLSRTIRMLMNTLGDELEGPIQDNPKTALIIASLAGFLAGDQRH